MSVPLFDAKLFKFILAGIANTVVGAGVMFVLFNVAHVSYWISSAANYVAGGICSFFLSKFFVFKDGRKNAAQILLFVLNLAVCYFIAYGVAKKIVFCILSEKSEQFRGNAALLAGMVLYTALNYIGQRIFVFKNTAGEK